MCPPDPEILRRATVRICTASGEHRGQGLLLDVGERETVVLTCHHVIAAMRPDDLHVAQLRPDGTLGEPLPARYDASRSRPVQDAVVLRGEFERGVIQPRLVALDPDAYAGALPKRAVGFTHMPTATLDARVGTTTRLDLPTEARGYWPDTPRRYVLPHAFRLSDPTDAREGVSGGVIAYEGGIIGLAQSARAAGPGQERELYLVPLSAWAEGWPALARLVQPLIDERLKAAATVRFARDLVVGVPSLSSDRDADLVLAEYRDVYVRRQVDARAREAFESAGALLVGRPMSGKTRLAVEILRASRELIVLIPRQPAPPPEFEAAGLRGRELALVIDDLHTSNNRMLEPLVWRSRLQDATGARVRVLATSRDGSDFRLVRDSQRPFLRALGLEHVVFMSSGDEDGRGEDLTFAQAHDLGDMLGLSEAEVRQRFDGTPGSLVLEIEAMIDRYHRLRDEEIGGIAASRLLDSLKVLELAGQNVFPEARVRRVAEEIRGHSTIATETWERLRRRSKEEGFGGFDERGEFQTYLPYLEKCVALDSGPTLAERQRVLRILQEDGAGAEVFKFAMGSPSADQELEALRHLAASEDPEQAAFGAVSLGLRLAHPDHGERLDDAERAYGQAISARPGRFSAHAAKLLGELRMRRGKLDEAEWAFRRFFELVDEQAPPGDGPSVAFQLGRILEERGQIEDAAALFRQAEASEHPYWAPHAALALGSLLVGAGETDEAAGALCRASRSSLADVVARGSLILAALQQESGQLEDAANAYRNAIDAGQRPLREAALFGLGDILEQQGHREQAERIFAEVMASTDEEFMPRSAIQLAFLLAREQRYDEAEQAFKAAIATGHPQHAANAAYNLAQLQARAGRFGEAEQSFSDAIASGHPEIAPRATLALGVLYLDVGLADAARRMFTQASDSGHPDAARLAQQLLASLDARDRTDNDTDRDAE